MKKLIKNFVKKNKFIYFIYTLVMQLFINILRLFIKVDDNTILFVVYGGKRYDDSPRFLYEYMKSNSLYKHYKFIWAFENPNEQDKVCDEEKIKIDTFKYYVTALKSKYWITNSSIDRGLRLKNKGCKYVVFQHGTLGIKKIGYDIEDNNKSFKNMKLSPIDHFIIQGKEESKFIESGFRYPSNIVHLLGLPRNEELKNIDDEKVIKLKKEFGIPLDKKVILYAPTYREFYNEKGSMNSFLKIPFDFSKFEKELSDEYVLLVTAHYEVSKILELDSSKKCVINKFGYPYLNDLIMVSDILISDYSSIVFDYFITEKPVYCYAYDYDLYMKERGTYLDLETLFYKGVFKDQDRLFEEIRNINYVEGCKFSKDNCSKYIYLEGNSVEKAVNLIFKD